MKTIIILALEGLAGWQIYAKLNTPTITNTVIETFEEKHTATEEQFDCDGRQYCSQMTSRAEAVFFINNCPNTKFFKRTQNSWLLFVLTKFSEIFLVS